MASATLGLFAFNEFTAATTQGALDAEQGGYENVDFARLDLLHGADV